MGTILIPIIDKNEVCSACGARVNPRHDAMRTETTVSICGFCYQGLLFPNLSSSPQEFMDAPCPVEG